ARTPIEPVSSTARMIGVESGLASESQDSRTLILVGSSSGASSDWVKSCDRDFDRATRACACQSASDHLAFPTAISFEFRAIVPATERTWRRSNLDSLIRGTRRPRPRIQHARSREPETRARVEGIAERCWFRTFRASDFQTLQIQDWFA